VRDPAAGKAAAPQAPAAAGAGPAIRPVRRGGRPLPPARIPQGCTLTPARPR